MDTQTILLLLVMAVIAVWQTVTRWLLQKKLEQANADMVDALKTLNTTLAAVRTEMVTNHEYMKLVYENLRDLLKTNTRA